MDKSNGAQKHPLEPTDGHGTVIEDRAQNSNVQKTAFIVDPTDLAGMIALMDEHGDSETAFRGTDSEGNLTSISIYHDTIIILTYQANGWIRRNVYERDGTSEELFDGRWDMESIRG